MTTSNTLRSSSLSKRRGVILLLVLAMMALFAMLIATFMLVTSQQFREADSARKIGTYAQTPQDDMQRVINQLISGSNLKSSVMRYYSLGATMYGDANKPGLAGTAQWIDKYVVPLNQPPYAGREVDRILLAFSVPPASTIEWLASAGNVITVYDSLSQTWKSTRIICNDPTTQNVIWVQEIPGITLANLPAALNGVDFVINPPAYSGTGVGYQPPTNPNASNADFWVNYIGPRLTGADTDGTLFALQLNPNAPSADNVAQLGYGLQNLVWSLNVDYTAPDVRSPFLAWSDIRFWSDGNGNNGGLVYDQNASAIIPSFLRPSLVQYYRDNNASLDDFRKIIMRPMPFDHPEFDGSNATLNTANLALFTERLADTHGTYLDVDSDGDGIKDSVWIDAGLPVRSDSNGRLYKPMVAVYCVDQDGKLNVNAQGNRAESLSYIADMTFRGSGFGPAGTDLKRGLFAANTVRNIPSLGGLSMLYQGMIDSTMTGPNLDSDALSRALIESRYQGVMSVAPFSETLPGDPTFNPIAPLNAVRAQLGVGIPLLNYFGYYGALPDYWDKGTLLYDATGNRFNTFSATTSFYALGGGVIWPLPDLPVNQEMNPYLFNPNGKTSNDSSFTLSELEAVLRQGDVDKVALPERLSDILGLKREQDDPDDNTKYFVKNTAPESLKLARYNVTTMSNDVPVPAAALADQNVSSVYELIRKCVVKERIRYAFLNNATVDPESVSGYDNTVVDAITAILVDMLPEEIRLGGKIDLNKLTENPDMFLQNWLAQDGTTGIVTINNAYYKALSDRAKMARGMYILTMALSYDKLYGVYDYRQEPNMSTYEYKCTIDPYIEPSYMNDVEIAKLFNSGAATDHEKAIKTCRELAATRIAQWAVNVVDFSDADATMTPFIFDSNPFGKDYVGSWNANSFDYANAVDMTARFTTVNTATNSFMRAIWGLERSDLVMTETAAWHDLRQGDTPKKEGGKPIGLISDWDGNDDESDGDARADHDEHYDQIRIPQGNAFIELYCTANPNQARQPSELYFHDGTNWRLDLGKMTPQLEFAELKTTIADTRVSMNQLPSPVWRAAIGESTNPNNSSHSIGSTDNNVIRRLIEAPDRFQPQPRQFRSPSPRASDTWSQMDNSCSVLGKGDPETNLHDISLDRIVWFNKQYRLSYYVEGQPMAPLSVNLSGPTIYHADYDRTFFNNFATQTLTGNGGLLPNQYLVVGSRRQAIVGAKARNVAPSAYGKPSDQQFVMRNLNNVAAETYFVSLTNNNNAVTMVAAAFPPIRPTIDTPAPIPGAEDDYDWSKPATYFSNPANWQTGWVADDATKKNNLWLGLFDMPTGNSDMTNTANGIGFSISEPLPQASNKIKDAATYESYYYKPPTQDNHQMLISGGTTYYLRDAYGDLANPTDESVTSEAKPFETFDGNNAEVPLEADEIVLANDTVQLYKSAFLQRVADPNRPYNPVTNPYITVDWNMFDLNVFNSEGDNLGEPKADFQKYKQANEYGTGLDSNDFDAYLAARQWGSEDVLPRPNSILASGATPPRTNDPVLPRLPNPWGRALCLQDATSLAHPARPTLDPSDTGYAAAIAEYTVKEAAWQTAFNDSLGEYGRLKVPATQPPMENAKLPGSEDAAIKQKFQGTLGFLNNMSIISVNSEKSKITVQEWNSGLNMLVDVQKDVKVGQHPGYVGTIYHGTPAILETTGTNVGQPAKTYLNATDSKEAIAIPFINLPWNNAPFANSYEIMQVPASAPGRFGVEFVDQTESHSRRGPYLTAEALWQRDANYDLVLPNNSTVPAGLPMPTMLRSGSLGSHARFGHLLNFLHANNVGPNLQFSASGVFADRTLFTLPTDSTKYYTTEVKQYGYPHLTFDLANLQTGTIGAVAKAEFVSLDLGNVLNFVHVPSRFMGTRDWNARDIDGDSVIEPGEWYSYPRFREPGKLNLNTLNAAGFAALIENRPYQSALAYPASVSTPNDLNAYYNSLQNKMTPFNPVTLLANLVPIPGLPLGMYTNFEIARGNVPAGFSDDGGTTTYPGSYAFATPYRGSNASWMLVSPGENGYAAPTDATLLRSNETFASWLMTNYGMTVPVFEVLVQNDPTEANNLKALFWTPMSFDVWLETRRGLTMVDYDPLPANNNDDGDNNPDTGVQTKTKLQNAFNRFVDFCKKESNGRHIVGNIIHGNINTPTLTPNMQLADNSYAALEGMQRLSDTTTTKSNVFAVWVTLGYFEVEKLEPNASSVVNLGSGISYDLSTAAGLARFNAIYPDGYVLKKEIGVDTGEIKRNRAFYIIDRSVPFGYRRGQKLNSEETILLKRFIE